MTLCDNGQIITPLASLALSTALTDSNGKAAALNGSFAVGIADDHKSYFSKRVTEELVRAATCEDNTVARVHLAMADLYQRAADAKLTDDAE